MTRRQLQITGTERTDVPPAVLEAGEELLEKRRAKRKAAEKAKESLLGVIALMQSHKIPELKVMDPDTEEYLTLRIDLDPKLRIKKTGEAEPEPIGDGIPSHPDAHPDDVAAGLIRQAERSMDDANVSETSEGDVVPPEKAAPKAKRAAKKKGK